MLYTLNVTSFKGFTVRISMWFQESDKQEKVIDFSVPCTLKQYMKWQLILNVPSCLEQFLAHLKRSKIQVAVTADCVIHVQMKVDNEKDLQKLCTFMFNLAMDEIGNSLSVREIVTTCKARETRYSC
jgi:hypothetical protein